MQEVYCIRGLMFILNEIHTCLRSLYLHRLRSLLSTLGVLFGVIAVIAMLSIGEGAKQETLEQIEQLGMNSIIIRQPAMSEEKRVQALENQSKGLTRRDDEALRNHIPNLAYDSPLKVIKATLAGTLAKFSPEVLAVTRSFGDMKALQMNEGRFICDLDHKGKNLVCVLGYEVARNLGKEGHAGNSLRLDNTHYDIVGVLRSIHWKESKNQMISHRNLDNAILIPLGSEISLSNQSPETQEELSEIVLQIRDFQDMEATMRLVKKILADSHGGYEDYQVIMPQELLQQAYRTQQTFNWVLGSLAAISLLVGGVGIMNIMLATVSERTREIGIRRAVGAGRRHILLQFLLETILLTLAGAILGIICGIGLSLVISMIAGWRTIVTVWSILLSLAMSLAVGICSGLFPAYQAAMMDPIKALRHD